MRAFVIALFPLYLLTVIPVFAQDAGHVHGNAAADERPGKEIRHTLIQGYKLTYRLLDLSQRNEMMKKMEGHSVLGMKKVADVTNHLMVYIQKDDGKIVPADVAFLVTDPDGKNFTTMTMGMYGGYGVDVSFLLSGAYKITTKIVTRDMEKVNLHDEFTFQVR